MNKLVIIIPVHNRIDFTQNCLDTLRKQSFSDYKIVVVDDGSSDGTRDMVKNDFPAVHIIEGDGNLWWTACVNLGIKYALEIGAEYILTLNNDTLAHEDYLENMIYWADKNKNALIGSLAIDAETLEPIYGGEIMNWKWDTSVKLLDILNVENRTGLHEISHFPGRGLLIPCSLFASIGLFDETKLPQYGADNDFTYRAARAGYKIYCNYDAKILIFPNANNSIPLRKEKNIKNYYNYLFGKKSNANLIAFCTIVIKNCPKKYLLQNLLIGISRRALGYFLM